MENYEIIEIVGRGGEGSVMKVRRKKGKKEGKDEEEILAMKKRFFQVEDFKDANDGLRETFAMLSVQSDYTIKCRDIFLQEEELTESNSNNNNNNNTPDDLDGGASGISSSGPSSSSFRFFNLCIVMDYCNGGDLFTFILDKKLDLLSVDGDGIDNNKKDRLVLWCWQLLMAVKDVHSSQLLHRDIKSENIFITAEESLVLGDFGLANRSHNTLGSNSESESSGTWIYSAPELIEGSSKYDKKSDIFSLGCVFLEMLVGIPLPVRRLCPAIYEDLSVVSNINELISSVRSGYGIQQAGKEGYGWLVTLLREMLCLDPSIRSSAARLLEHPVFAKLNQPHASSLSESSLPSMGQLSSSSSQYQRMQLTSENEISMAIALLSNALVDDPRWACVENREIADSIRTSGMTVLVKAFLKWQGVWGIFKGEKLAGVALWSPPTKLHKRPPVGVVAKLLVKQFKLKSMKQVKLHAKTMKATFQCYSEALPEPHWTMFLCGVEPYLQNKGIGKELLAPVLEWADSRKKVCGLITFSSRSIEFFRQLGFEVYKHLGKDKMAFDSWVMRREPQ